jgi:hypothetical protein
VLRIAEGAVIRSTTPKPRLLKEVFAEAANG